MKSLIPWRQKESTAVSPWNSDWFDRMWENPFKSLVSPFSKHFSGMPSVDVVEDKNEVTVKAEVPGMTEKDIDLSWQEGVLRIRGEKKNENVYFFPIRHLNILCSGRSFQNHPA